MTYNYEIPPDAVVTGDTPGQTVFFEGVLNGCEACAGWRNQAVQVVEQANNAIDQAKAASDRALKAAEATENGQALLKLHEELKKAKQAQAAAEKRAAHAEAHRNALPRPKKIKVNGIDILEGVQVLLDALASSMDAGSGFLDYREWCALRQVGHALGVADLDGLSQGDVFVIQHYGPKGRIVSRWPDPAAPLTNEPLNTPEEES